MCEIDREAIFTALADPSRRLILTRLQARNGQTLSQLGEGLPITRQAVSKHLKILETANLLFSEKSGRERLHFLNPVPLRAVASPIRFDGYAPRYGLPPLLDEHRDEVLHGGAA